MIKNLTLCEVARLRKKQISTHASPYWAWSSQTNTPLDSSKYSLICDQNLKYSLAIASEYLRFLSQMKEYLEESSARVFKPSTPLSL